MVSLCCRCSVISRKYDYYRPLTVFIIVLSFLFTSCDVYPQQGGVVFFNRPGFDYNQLNLNELILAHVTRCIDGDTIDVEILTKTNRLSNQERVRFVGVDTPETKDPRKPVQYYGLEASQYTKNRLQDQFVFLGFDTDLRDKYGRLLCYVIFDDRTMINYDLVYYGYGFSYRVFPFYYQRLFDEAEMDARANKRGLWQ